MRPYTAADTLRIAKRYNNPKRSYLLVNPLQAKHIPVSPTAALEMMSALGGQVAAPVSGGPGWSSASPRQPPPSAPLWRHSWGRTASISTPPGSRWTATGSCSRRNTATLWSISSLRSIWRSGSTGAPPWCSWMTSSPPAGPSSTWSASCGRGIPGWRSGSWRRRPC